MLKTRLCGTAITSALVGSIFFVAACGALPQQRSSGSDQATQIAFLGNDLVVASIYLSKNFEVTVSMDDVQRAGSHVFGVKRDATTASQVVLVKVKPGLHQVKISQNGRVSFTREVFVSEGQTTQVEVTP